MAVAARVSQGSLTVSSNRGRRESSGSIEE